jgi:hypothetical protein
MKTRGDGPDPWPWDQGVDSNRFVVEQQGGECMDLGIFIPIGNNGWMMSKNSPQYMPSFRLNRTIAEKAEAYDFNFLLSMVKLRGFGGQTEFWDHNLESFTLMAGLATVTERIQLFASVALPTLPPALVARMAATICRRVVELARRCYAPSTSSNALASCRSAVSKPSVNQL